jgi:hypothetical protein
MRVQIQIPPELWQRLCEVAHREHRYPRQQIEFLVSYALSKDEKLPALCDGAPPDMARSQEVVREC